MPVKQRVLRRILSITGHNDRLDEANLCNGCGNPFEFVLAP